MKTSSSIITNVGTKRSLDDEEMEVESTSDNTTVNGSTKVESKKQCINQSSSTSSSVVSKDHILNFPLEGEDGKCCHLKVSLIYFK